VSKLTPEEWKRMQKPLKKRRHKYNATPTTVGSEGFPSRLEARTWEKLLWYQRMGLIKNLKRYPPQIEYYVKHRATLDFAFENEVGELVYADAKGFETKEWRELVKWWKKQGPADLQVYKGHGDGVELFETVSPTEEE
jgi:hypothetical protein